MLSFQQKNTCTFASTQRDAVPADVHRNPTRSMELDASDVRPSSLDVRERRERYLVDLASKYISRFQIAVGDHQNTAPTSVATDTQPLPSVALERAFFAAVPISHERRVGKSETILTLEQQRARADALKKAAEKAAIPPPAPPLPSFSPSSPSSTASSVASSATATISPGTTTTVSPGTTTAANVSSEKGKLLEADEKTLTTETAPSVETVIDSGTQCWCGTMLHDWSLDAIRCDALQIKNRQHVLCKYTHPCNDGNVKVRVADEKSVDGVVASRDTKLSPARSSAFTAPASVPRTGGQLYMSELRKKISARVGQDGEQIVGKVEQRITEKRNEHERHLEAEKKRANDLKQQNAHVCTSMIEKTRALDRVRDCRMQKRTQEEKLEYEESDAEDDEEEEEDSDEQATEDDSSTTFSDEDDEDDEEEEDDDEDEDDDEEKQVVVSRTICSTTPSLSQPLGSASLKIVNTTVTAVSTSLSLPSASSSTTTSLPAVAFVEKQDSSKKEQTTTDVTTTQRADATKKEDSPVNKEDSTAQNEKKTEIKKEIVMRHCNVEVMIPVCESTDSFQFFEQLECPYVLQWANDERRRLHVYRRFYVSTRSYLLYSTRETHFQLVTTIELV